MSRLAGGMTDRQSRVTKARQAVHAAELQYGMVSRNMGVVFEIVDERAPPPPPHVEIPGR